MSAVILDGKKCALEILENIKDETLYITRKSVEKYVDAVIDKIFKKYELSIKNSNTKT